MSNASNKYQEKCYGSDTLDHVFQMFVEWIWHSRMWENKNSKKSLIVLMEKWGRGM